MSDRPSPNASTFRAYLSQGRFTSIEEYLQSLSLESVVIHDLLDLVQQEWNHREAQAQSFTLAEYLSRFPEHAKQIEALWALQSMLVDVPKDQAKGKLVLPSYRLLERIGQGASGDVYRAQDDLLGRPLAIKVLRSKWLDNTVAVERFLAEAKTTAKLQHPGIAPIYETGQAESDEPYIAMKLVEGKTLATLLSERPPGAWEPFLATFEAIVQTVAYAHSQGVVHRDLKPANVMVGAFGEVQVMDWGLSKQTVVFADPDDDSLHLTRQGATIGTPAYAAPEQMSGRLEAIGPGSDLFSLGAILAEILTGSPAYTSLADARTGNLAPTIARLDGCGAPSELIDIAKHCLTINPKERPGTAQALAQSLADYRLQQQEKLRRAQVAVAQATAEKRAQRRVNRFRLILASLVVSLLALGVYWLLGQIALRNRLADQLEQLTKNRDWLLNQDVLSRTEVSSFGLESEQVYQESRNLWIHPRLRREIDNFNQLNRIDERDTRELRQFENARIEKTSLGKIEIQQLSTELTAAFAKIDIDLDADSATVADRIKTRWYRRFYVEYLEFWAAWLARENPNDPRAKRFFEIANRLYPNPTRERVRQLLLSHTNDDLTTLAKLTKGFEVPTSLSVIAGSILAARPGHYDAGIAILRRAQGHDPEDFWANHNLAYYLCQGDQPRYDEALRYFQAAQARYKDLAAAKVNFGNALRQAGFLHESIEQHRHAVNMSGNLAQGYNNLANGYWRLGKVKDAIYSLIRAYEIDPTRTHLQKQIAQGYAILGQKQSACEHYRTYLKLEPNDLNRPMIEIEIELLLANERPAMNLVLARLKEIPANSVEAIVLEGKLAQIDVIFRLRELAASSVRNQAIPKLDDDIKNQLIEFAATTYNRKFCQLLVEKLGEQLFEIDDQSPSVFPALVAQMANRDDLARQYLSEYLQRAKTKYETATRAERERLLRPCWIQLDYLDFVILTQKDDTWAQFWKNWKAELEQLTDY